MSQPDNNNLASAINLADVAAHPATAIAALIEVVRRQEELIKEHEMRLDKHGEYIRELRYPEEKAPAQARPAKAAGKKQDIRLNYLESLLISRGNEPLTFSEVGKYLELGSRTGKDTTRRQNMTIFGKVLAEKIDRFYVFDSNTQKGAKMVCLSSEYFAKGKKV